MDTGSLLLVRHVFDTRESLDQHESHQFVSGLHWWKALVHQTPLTLTGRITKFGGPHKSRISVYNGSKANSRESAAVFPHWNMKLVRKVKEGIMILATWSTRFQLYLFKVLNYDPVIVEIKNTSYTHKKCTNLLLTFNYFIVGIFL